MESPRCPPLNEGGNGLFFKKELVRLTRLPPRPLLGIGEEGALAKGTLIPLPPLAARF